MIDSTMADGAGEDLYYFFLYASANVGRVKIMTTSSSSVCRFWSLPCTMWCGERRPYKLRSYVIRRYYFHYFESEAQKSENRP